MDTEHEGLPVKGYKPQSSRNIAVVDEHKIMEEHLLRRIEDLEASVDPDCDPRCLSIARTTFQEAFMWLNRAVFKPARVDLPED